jgi:hypothetical protein
VVRRATALAAQDRRKPTREETEARSTLTSTRSPAPPTAHPSRIQHDACPRTPFVCALFGSSCSARAGHVARERARAVDRPDFAYRRLCGPDHLRHRLSAGDGRGVPASAQVQAGHHRGRAHLGPDRLRLCAERHDAQAEDGRAAHPAGIRRADALPAGGDDLHQRHAGAPGLRWLARLADPQGLRSTCAVLDDRHWPSSSRRWPTT